MKKLFRVKENKVFAGVCGGLAVYFNTDTSLVRVIAIFAGFALFPWSVLAYIACAMVIPELKEGEDYYGAGYDEYQPQNYTSGFSYDPEKSRFYAGAALVGLGALLLLKNILGWFDFRLIASVGLIAAGIFIITRKREE